MTKTANDICEKALRDLGVLAEGEEMSAAAYQDALAHLNSLFEELTGATNGEAFPFTWALSATPEWAFIPLSQMLSVELAPSYGRPVPRNQWFWGMQRLRRHAFPDDRGARADLDEDGTVTTDEQYWSDRGAFF